MGYIIERKKVNESDLDLFICKASRPLGGATYYWDIYQEKYLFTTRREAEVVLSTLDTTLSPRIIQE